MPPDKLDVLIHPESIVHSLVHYADGSVLAQLGMPDMAIPIAYALGWPERIATSLRRGSISPQIGALHFARGRGGALPRPRPGPQRRRPLAPRR